MRALSLLSHLFLSVLALTNLSAMAAQQVVDEVPSEAVVSSDLTNGVAEAAANDSDPRPLADIARDLSEDLEQIQEALKHGSHLVWDESAKHYKILSAAAYDKLKEECPRCEEVTLNAFHTTKDIANRATNSTMDFAVRNGTAGLELANRGISIGTAKLGEVADAAANADYAALTDKAKKAIANAPSAAMRSITAKYLKIKSFISNEKK